MVGTATLLGSAPALEWFHRPPTAVFSNLAREGWCATRDHASNACLN